MIELRKHRLIFSFPEVHEDAQCGIEFQRTLRIPDDNREYPLPPGLGTHLLNHVDDFKASVPQAWLGHGGVFLPMYQAEALWINFGCRYPMAVKVAAGKINAVSGGPWKNELCNDPQDYVVIPDQPWLDGFCVGKGLIRQFVAMPLGKGYTAEEQLTGEDRHGGIQIVVHPLKASIYEKTRAKEFESRMMICESISSKVCEMGLAPGGLMRQSIYSDRYGIDAWDTSARSRCFIHILNSVEFLRVTGTEPPSPPPTPKAYAAAGLPWFEYYDGDQKALEGARRLAGLDSVAAIKLKKGEGLMPDNDPVSPALVKTLGARKQVVREGNF